MKAGLVKRELEIRNLLKTEKIDILFLNETDSVNIHKESDYNIEGFSTILQKRDNENSKVRLICLINKKIMNSSEIRLDLMSPDFPSIWVEKKNEGKKSIVIGGFYREWNHNGKKSVSSQIKGMRIFAKQIERAVEDGKPCVIMGDANLCSRKWKEEGFNYKSIAEPVLLVLEQNGFLIADIGTTYLADHAQASGAIAESAIDHIYSSKSLAENLKFSKLKNCSSDHMPILCEYNDLKKKVLYEKKVTKRRMKNFTKEAWNSCLANKDWSFIDSNLGLNLMTEKFAKTVEEALDEIAPIKTFKVRSFHKFGLSDRTKELMKARDQTRLNISSGNSTSQKLTMLKKYKVLRNQVNSALRKDSVDFNNNRSTSAKDENEVWKVVNEVLQPKKENEWQLKEGSTTITEEQIIANTFNKFFVDKIEDLKANIDPEYVEDPLTRLKKKMNKKNLLFKLKQITSKELLIIVKKIKKKKSAGVDGVSQEQLILGAATLAHPLTVIFNKSMEEGSFPECWKEALITPVLKKGDPQIKENYRPVSCLPAASKLLEKVICEQATDYLEKNHLLPDNQHGFRQKRSTMSAWADIQQDWATKTEAKEKTGVLLWDLSAAFDTLDVALLCEKLSLYGFDNLAVKWFNSFLSNRTQKVKIGEAVSMAVKLTSGVPQGGILSPLIFVLYVSDLSDWLEFSKVFTYADDTSSSVSGKNLQDIIRKMESDAVNVLKFMASNGLVANPKKTT